MEVSWRNLPWYSKALYWVTYQLSRMIPSYGSALRMALQVEANVKLVSKLADEEIENLRAISPDEFDAVFNRMGKAIRD